RAPGRARNGPWWTACAARSWSWGRGGGSARGRWPSSGGSEKLSTHPLAASSPVASRPAPTLRAERITSGYGGVPVVRDVSIDVGPGEVVTIIGPNGAGKSTLLKSLVGLLRVGDGRVWLAGTNVTKHAPEDPARR